MSTDLRLMNFKIADGDRALLESLSAHNSDASFSAIIRRLIRQEAQRIGVASTANVSEQQPEADRQLVAN